MTTRFSAELLLARRTATGIEVPQAALDALDGGKRPKVRVTIGAYTYRSSVGSMDGRAMLPVSAEHRAGAGIAAGDRVEVTLELDTAPREIELPDDLAEALAAAPAAREFFDSLSYSRQNWFVSTIESARRAETRRRRVERAVEMLGAGRAR